MQLIKIQPSSHTDQIKGGQELTKLPYPFYVDGEGSIQSQDFWQGTPARVIGCQRDLSIQRVDLWWEDALTNPQQMVGMYLVTADQDGTVGSHYHAIQSVELLAK